MVTFWCFGLFFGWWSGDAWQARARTCNHFAAAFGKEKNTIIQK